MPKMSRFRKAFRLAEKANKHAFRNGCYKHVPKDDALDHVREINYDIKNKKRKNMSLKLR